MPDFKQAADEKAPKKSASSVISKKKKKESTAANTSALSKSNDTTRDNSFSNSSFDRQQPQFNVVHKDYSENFLQQDEMAEAKQEMRRSKTKHASGVSSGRKSNVQDDKECAIF